jgi:hypothetical protein
MWVPTEPTPRGRRHTAFAPRRGAHYRILDEHGLCSARERPWRPCRDGIEELGLMV